MGTPWTLAQYRTVYNKPIRSFVCPSDSRNLLGTPPGTDGAPTSYLGVTGAHSQSTGVPAGYQAGDGFSARDGIFDPGAHFAGTDAQQNAEAAKRGHRLGSVTDGLSNTLLLGERPPDNGRAPNVGSPEWGWWGTSDFDSLLATVNTVYLNAATETGSNPVCVAPGRFSPGNPAFNCHANHFYSLHTGGGNWAWGDGSVRFLAYSAQPLTLPLATRAGGEVVGEP
jgi:prepilin-type processing-associated H-X9-DG protein